MRKLSVFLFLSMMVFFSCSTQTQKTDDNQFLVHDMDSIKVNNIDSLSQIAWGDALFGMSKKEAIKTEVFKGGSVYSNQISSPHEKKMIKGFDFMNIDASFFNDRLYRVDIEGYYRNANYYDTEIKSRVHALKDLVEEKYGEPTNSYGMPSFFELKPNEYNLAYLWKIGNKEIKIRVDEEFRGSQYRVTCLIIHNVEVVPVIEYNDSIRKEQESINGNLF